MKEKPLFGDPCNSCGRCCIAGPCGTAYALLGQIRGRCAALQEDGKGGFVCGLLTKEAPAYITEAAAISIGSGIGCDASETLADQAARAQRIPEMIAAARAARRDASPEAEIVLRRWGMAPP